MVEQRSAELTISHLQFVMLPAKLAQAWRVADVDYAKRLVVAKPQSNFTFRTFQLFHMQSGGCRCVEKRFQDVVEDFVCRIALARQVAKCVGEDFMSLCIGQRSTVADQT